MEENMTMNEMQNQTVDAVEEVQKAAGPNATGAILLLGAGIAIGFDWRKAKKASASKKETSEPIEGEVIDEK